MQRNGGYNAKKERRSIFGSSAVLTALLVILLIFAALTTATFAWFSSNRSVTAGTTEFTANNADTGGNLKIYWGATENGDGRSIEMLPITNMKPTTPVAKIEAGDLFSDMRFQTAIQNGTDNEATFSAVSDVNIGTMLLSGNTSGDTVRQEFFTVENSGSDDPTSSIRMSVKFGDIEEYRNNDIIRLAVFVADRNPTVAASYKCVGTMGYTTNGDTYYGNITNGALVVSQQKYQATTSVDLIHGLQAETKLYVKILAWFDGRQLTVDRAGGKAQVTIGVELV